MLFHASIGARNPARVAAALAEIWGTQAYPFPPFPGSFLVIADDDRGTALEIVPLGHVLVPGDSEVATRWESDESRPSETHIAIAVPCAEAHIEKIARREGWTCRTCSRAGHFRVVELWVENRIMIAALTPEMQREYVAFARPQKWEAVLREMNAPGDPRIGYAPGRDIAIAKAA